MSDSSSETLSFQTSAMDQSTKHSSPKLSKFIFLLSLIILKSHHNPNKLSD